MKILVAGNDESWNELTGSDTSIEWLRVDNMATISASENMDAVFNLSTDAHLEDYSKIENPVFINSVARTLKEINAGNNIFRINGWKGFLKRNSWEIAGNISALHHEILNGLQKKIIVVPDEPGFISARIIAMIINEAFYAKGEKVSTENEINIAMKLGTNYPFGPFEWANEIGIKYIYELLMSLSKTDPRYAPSSSLQLKVKEQ